ncbi:MAG: T9SS type A sorting domain-containing protein [Chitinophagales bacterium]
MKKTILILFVLCNIAAFSQTVFSTSGKSLSNSQVLIDNTLGEPVTFTLQNASIKLTQGFQQNNYNISTGVKNAQLDISIKAFPNPTADKIQIQLSKHHSENLKLSLYDIKGQLVWYGKLGNDVEMQNVDVSSLASGTYILQLTDETEKLVNTYKIEKSNN